MRPTKFLKIYLVTVLILVGLAAAINFIVDPYLLNGLVNLKKFNIAKPEMMKRESQAKAYTVRRLKPKSIALGSSRTGHGIDTFHAGWDASATPRYNLGLGGSNMYTAYRYFQHAQAVQPLKQIVLGVDFFMFNVYRRNASDLDEDILKIPEGKNSIWLAANYAKSLLSFDTVKSSYITVQANRAGEHPYLEADGRMNGVFYEKKVSHLGGYHASFREEIKGYLTYIPIPRKIYEFESKEIGYSTLDIFRKLVESARREHIDLRLFISPSHARQLEGIRMLGLWPKFEQWKRELIKILAEDSAAHPNERPFPLWDFSGYNTYTIEDVPPPGDTRAKMQWYWESSHYKKELGDKVLDKIFGIDRNLPSDFGRQINADNIEQHLAWIRAQQQEYIKSHPADVQEIEQDLKGLLH